MVSPSTFFAGDGSEAFEAVRIPLVGRDDLPDQYVVCVSSQVGCAMGCEFCATARLGFRRNLATWEIVDQVVKIQADSAASVRGVVFMGMGEPFLNYDAVIRAAEVLSEPCGLAIAAKAISISTVGITPAIRRFTSEGHRYRLVVSLAAADPAHRAALMPVEQMHPLPELIEALREYHQTTRRRVTLAVDDDLRREHARGRRPRAGRTDPRPADQARSDRRQRSDRPLPAAVAGRTERVSRCTPLTSRDAGRAALQRRPRDLRRLRDACGRTVILDLNAAVADQRRYSRQRAQ